MEKTLIVVDYQNDFITGSLGTPEAQAIFPNITDRVRRAEALGESVIFTRDFHTENYLNTQEGRFLPIPHCRWDTDGFHVPREILDAAEVYTFCDKPTFGSIDLAGRFVPGFGKPLKQLTLIGVCTDICIVSNALLLKTFLPEVEIHVDASCCAGTTPENHYKALDIMKQCQIIIENDDREG